MALGSNIGALIKAKGLSYGDVARGIGIEESQAIWALVKRNSKKSEFAGRLASFFGVPVERLLASDFDVQEATATPGAPPAPPPIEEALAIKRLRNAVPDWRRYVLGLAMIDDHRTQELLLRTMRDTVPDERVARAYGQAPHVAQQHELKRVRQRTESPTARRPTRAKNT